MLRFVVDIVLLSESEATLQKMFNRREKLLRDKFGFKINKIETNVKKNYRNGNRHSVNIKVSNDVMIHKC